MVDRYNYIICFLLISGKYNDYLTFAVYYIEQGKITIIDIRPDYYKANNITYIKSETNKNMDLALVCLTNSNNHTFCIKFNFLYLYFYSILELIKSCRNEKYGMRLLYNHLKEETIFICSDIDGSIQAGFFDNYLKLKSNKMFKSLLNCESINGLAIIYLNCTKKYFILSDVICNGLNYPFQELESTYIQIFEKEKKMKQKYLIEQKII